MERLYKNFTLHPLPFTLPMTSFLLKIWRIDQTCLFELTWEHRTLNAKLTYPETLTTLYQQWQQAYLNFYRSFRARPGISLSLPQPTTDWRKELVQAEAAFLAEFHYWLNHAELVAIRGEIAAAAAKSSQVDVFIRTDAPQMVKLPWESWQIGTEFGTTNPIRIFRTGENLQARLDKPVRRQRQRILVALGDDTGLDFQVERQAIASLAKLVEVEFVGWRVGQASADIKTAICQAIADEKGWDILCFAGHSNETEITGGELVIAPQTSILISEIAQYLQVAQQRGLQFAIFNSCNGFKIAESLISLGLSQVAVMREPIHNEVAKEFFIQFLRHLAEYEDVQSAMLGACQFLKLEKNLTYPSAYLIPSLFSHPQAQPFRLQRLGWKHRLKQWQPTKYEAVTLGTLALISTFLPLQSWLIDYRQAVQAMYRHATLQGMTAQLPPPVLLVQVDEASLQKDQVEIINQNLDRAYLAKLVKQVTDLNASVVGIDYLLFRHQPRRDKILAEALQTAVTQKGTQFIFAATLENFESKPKWVKALPEIAHPKWRIDADMDVLGDPPVYARVVGDTYAEGKLLPLAYQLVKQQEVVSNRWDDRAKLHPVSFFAVAIGQMWLRPLIDFSIPPEQVYKTIPAWQLLQPNTTKIGQPIVIITPGGHIDAGVKPGEDNFTSAIALNYWRGTAASQMTGGEVHAYLVHNLINHRLIIPIPDLWTIAVVGLLGKGIVICLGKGQITSRQTAYLCAVPILYTAVSLQSYIALAILLPWVFPTLTYCVYLFPLILRRRRHA